MKHLKKNLAIILVAVVAVVLVGCGPSVNKNGVPSNLKENYAGYSKVYGYDSLIFPEGGTTLSFDSKSMVIKNSHGEENVFRVIPTDKLPSEAQGYLKSIETALKDSTHFTIEVAVSKDRFVDESHEAYGKGPLYEVILTEGGDKIRIVEFHSGDSDVYYDFNGEISK